MLNAASAPWSVDWWYSIIRDLHNQPGLERGEDECFGYPGWDGDNTANANLIAAAPELYEALQTLVSWNIKRGPFDEPLGESEQVPEINIACAALRKARGEPNPKGHTGGII